MSENDHALGFTVSPSLIGKLEAFGVRKSYKAGEVILKENTKIASIPIVLSGILRVIRSEADGREILLYYIKGGESCVMSFLGGMHNETSKVKAEVEERAEILFLPMDKVHLFIREHPEWLEYIFGQYHKRFEELLEVINAIAFRKVDDRLLSLLGKKAEITGSRNLYLTHEQLANELGTARVVVSRLLKQLEEEGRVKLGRNKLRLL